MRDALPFSINHPPVSMTSLQGFASLVTALLVASLVVLTPGCSSGGGGGGGSTGAPAGTPAGSPAGDEVPDQTPDSTLTVEFLEPTSGAVLNTDTPRFVASFPGARIARDAVRISIDGQTVVPGDDWVLLFDGVSGRLPTLTDGAHEVAVSIRDNSGTEGTSSVRFETSTGGGPTRIIGRLLDPDRDVPIVGAPVYLQEMPTMRGVTDNSGTYVLLLDAEQPAIPVGVHLIFDPTGLTFADDAGEYVYPLYKRPIEVLPGAINAEAPCYLPKVRPAVTFSELAAQGIFDCTTQRFLQPYVLSVDVGTPVESLVVALTIPQGTFVGTRDNNPACSDGIFLAIAPVDKDKAPSNLPRGTDPSLLITVQPTGLRFFNAALAPASLPISFPNRDEMPIGSELTLFSVDHNTGEFTAMGVMAVDATNPARLVTISGGIQGGSWHCSCPPAPDGDASLEALGCGVEEEVAINPLVDTGTGVAREFYALPARTLFDEPWGPVLVHSSQGSIDQNIFSLGVRFDRRAAVADTISMETELADIPVGKQVWYSTDAVPERDTVHLALPGSFDLTNLDTGIYRYSIALTNHYQTSSVTGFSSGWLPVLRTETSPFGSGWSLLGDDFILAHEGTEAFLVEGGRGVRRFTAAREPLDSWRREGHPEWGEWLVQDHPEIGMAAHQVENGRPTFFVSDRDYFDTTISGTIYVEGGSTRDYIGFAFGYRTPASGSHVDDYDMYLFDWRPDGRTGSTPGMTLSRVRGRIEPSEVVRALWRSDRNDQVPAYEVIAEGPATPWVPLVAHRYELTYLANRILIRVDGQTVFDVPGEYEPGKFAFYNYSTRGAAYSAIATSDANVLEGTSGDYSRLSRNPDGTWQRLHPDGAVADFDSSGRISQRLDRRGRRTGYKRDTTGRLLSIEDPAGGVTTLEYEGSLVSSFVDPANRTTVLGHEGRDLVSIQDPAGHTVGYTYSDGRISSTRDRDGRINRFEYDPAGRFRRATYPDGSTREVMPRSPVVLGQLDGTVGTPDEPADPFSAASTAAFYVDEAGRGSTQRLRAMENSVGRRALEWIRETRLSEDTSRWTRRVVDEATRLVTEETVLEGPGQLSDAVIVAQTSFGWDFTRGLLKRVVRDGLGRAPERVTEFSWHPERAWMVELREAVGTPDELVTIIGRDSSGNVNRIFEQRDDGGIALTRFDFDAPGALRRVEDPTGVETILSRDPETGSVASATVGGRTISLGRSGTGAVMTSTLPGGEVTTFHRDPLDRLMGVTDPAAGLTEYTRVPSGLLATVRSAGTPDTPDSPRHRFRYDLRGRLRTWTDPMGGVRTYTYSPDNVLTEVVDPRGVVETTLRDAGGRLKRIEYRRLADDSVGDFTEYVYGPLDRIRSVETPDTHLRFEYTPFGEVERTEQSLEGDPTAEVSTTYDARGRRRQVSTSLDGLGLGSASFSYGLSGRLQGIRATALGFEGTYTLERDAAGRRRRLERPGGGISTYNYDPSNGQLITLETQILGVPTARDEIVHDLNLNVDSWFEVRSLIPSGALDLVHDVLSRLSSTTSNEIAAWSQDYGKYDASGNRRAEVNLYDPAGRILSDTLYAYQHDRAGNVVGRSSLQNVDPPRTYERDLRGRIGRILDGGQEAAVFTYDGLGRRVQIGGVSPVDGEWVTRRLVYDREDVVAHLDANAPVRVFTHGPGFDEPWAVTTATSHDTTQLIADARGSVIQHVRSGEVVAEWRYDAFGNVVDGDLPMDDIVAYGYRGREFDATSELYYNRARYMDPRLGRFLSPEPLLLGLLGGTNTQVQNPYTYAVNNPVTFGDAAGTHPVYIGDDPSSSPNENERDPASGMLVGFVTYALSPGSVFQSCMNRFERDRAHLGALFGDSAFGEAASGFTFAIEVAVFGTFAIPLSLSADTFIALGRIPVLAIGAVGSGIYSAGEAVLDALSERRPFAPTPGVLQSPSSIIGQCVPHPPDRPWTCVYQ